MTRTALLTLAAMVVALPARAQTDPVTAQALFDEGKRLMAKGDAVLACPKLAESERLDPGVGTLLNLGDCYDKIGKPSRAWVTFLEAESMALREGQADRARYAKRRASEVEPKLVRLTIEVPAQARVVSLEVFRDGEIVREPLWGTAIPVDPGDHVVEARAPGYKTWRVSVAASREPVTITISPFEKEETPVVEPPPPAIDRAPPVTFESIPPPPPPEPPPPTTARTAGFVTGGLGLAGVAAGALFGVLAIDRDNAARGAGCDKTTCPTPSALAISSDAKTFAVASDIAFIAGGVLVVTGIVCLLAAPRSPAARVARTFVFGGTF